MTTVEAAPIADVPRPAPLGAVVAAELPALAQTAPAVEPAPAAAPPPVSAIHHVVAPGDTIYAIGRRYGVGPQAIATANGMDLGATLRVGQRIALPAGASDRGPEAAFPGVRRPAESFVTAVAQSQPTAPVTESPAPATAPVVTQPPVQALTPAPLVRPTPPVEAPLARPTPPVAAPLARPVVPPSVPLAQPTRPSPAPVQQQAPAPVFPTPAPAAPPMAAAPTGPSFAWPIRGDILAPFGPSGVGQRNDGVRIAASEGAPVRAAAAGRVVYAGDQVKGGFGKLVLVEHADRWFTAYAHMGEIRVRMQDRVAAGQELGAVGRTGSVAQPQLYFEVRHAPTPTDRARPLDPLPLLPRP